jgi:hypothetical protein
LDETQQVAARAREDIADERDVILLRDIIVLAVNVGIARKWQPRGTRDADAAEQVDPVALCSKHDVEAWRPFAASVEVEVGIDGPEGTRPAFGRQVVP